LGEHGHYVNTDGKFVFRDGAIVEAGMVGSMIPPPEDQAQVAKVVAEYWQIVSHQDEQAFVDYKSYLGGHGQRQPLWATFYTEEEQLAHLRTLQGKAKRARARYLAAKRKVKESIPFWMEERNRHEVEDARRKH